jgi:hypothetical protein
MILLASHALRRAGKIRQFSDLRIVLARDADAAASKSSSATKDGDSGGYYNSLRKIDDDVDMLFPVTENARRRMIRRLTAEDAARATGGASGGLFSGLVGGGGVSAPKELELPGPPEGGYDANAGAVGVATGAAEGEAESTAESAAAGAEPKVAQQQPKGLRERLLTRGTSDGGCRRGGGNSGGRAGASEDSKPAGATSDGSKGRAVPEAQTEATAKPPVPPPMDVDERDEFNDSHFWRVAEIAGDDDIDLPPPPGTTQPA